MGAGIKLVRGSSLGAVLLQKKRCRPSSSNAHPAHAFRPDMDAHSSTFLAISAFNSASPSINSASMVDSAGTDMQLRLIDVPIMMRVATRSAARSPGHRVRTTILVNTSGWFVTPFLCTRRATPVQVWEAISYAIRTGRGWISPGFLQLGRGFLQLGRWLHGHMNNPAPTTQVLWPRLFWLCD